MLQHGLDLLFEDWSGNKTYAAVHFLAVLDEDNGRDVADSEAHGEDFVLFYIAFADDGQSVVVLSQFLNDGGEALTGAAPCCPKIYYDRLAGCYQSLEIACVDCLCHINLRFNDLRITIYLRFDYLTIDTIGQRFAVLDVVQELPLYLDFARAGGHVQLVVWVGSIDEHHS